MWSTLPSPFTANAEALRMEWPRIPLLDWPDGDQDGAVDTGSNENVFGCRNPKSPGGSR